MKRFDVDGDGTLTLIEWERAREAAHRQVMDERRSHAADPGIHVLQCPNDDRPFLLAAGDAEALARRYRLHAVVGLAVFLAATTALAWLLLNSLL